MKSSIYADAKDIELWADRRDAQGTLPKLIRRLILATAKRVVEIQFRSDEGIQLGGWDGIAHVLDSNAHVPEGFSGWELSAERSVRGKADDVYTKRSAEPLDLDTKDTTFIFVTPRRWANKEEWAGEKRQKGIWKYVRAYDAENIETWLEQALAVHLWFSIKIGKHPLGVTDLDHFWDAWSGATKPPLSFDLVTAGRDNEIPKIHHWLRSEPSVLGLKADTREEAIAYFTASLSSMKEEEKELVLSRAIIVEDAAAWDLLALGDNPLILIPTFSDRSKVASTIAKGHHILIPLDRSESDIGNPLSISRLHRKEAEKALTAMSLPEAQVRYLAALARRSLGALRRKLAINSTILTPEWSKPENAGSLLSPLLAGGWDDEKIADQEAIKNLAGREYSELREILISWNYKPDPPVRLVKHTWMVAAREDAWHLLARYLIDNDFKQFESVTLSVLGEIDPCIELSVSQRLTASIRGVGLKHSGHLRVGLAETLALMATFSDLYPLSAMKGQDWADRIISKLLNQSKDWHLWASLSPVLPLLAEASPDIFLEMVERDLSLPSPCLMSLFRDAKYEFGQDSPHTGLLWALEVLAWSPEYLSRTAVLLAKLARLDPGGCLTNRPINSLREIFLVWHPCTAANLDNQLKVLDAIRHKEPQVAWDLLIKLLPSSHEVATNTAKPEYRNWVPEEEISMTIGEVLKASNEIVRRLLDDVGTSGTRWQSLIDVLDQLPKAEFDTIVDYLSDMNLEGIPQRDHLQIWEALRKLLSHHLQHSDAKWALQQAAIERLKGCYVHFEPEDPILKRSWLFSSNCDFPEAGHARGREREEAVNEARIHAVDELFSFGGLSNIIELARQTENPYSVGWALGKSEALNGEEEQLLSQGLGSTDNVMCNTAFGFLYGRVAVNGQEWLNNLRSSEFWKSWTAQKRADYYLCLCFPFSKQTWDAIEKEEDETQRLYWSRVCIFGRGELDTETCEYAVLKLSEYGRLGSAIELMGHYCSKFSNNPKLVADLLDRFAHKEITEKIDWNSLSYDIAQLLNLLETSGKIDDNELGHFEWSFLPLLHHHRLPKILYKKLAEDPEFFIELIKLLYCAEGEDPKDLTEERRVRARLSFDLLQDWRQPPGINNNGSVNPEKLRYWVSRAHELAYACGRGKIADQHIGQVLAHYPIGADGAWPHEALRDLIEDLGNKGIEDGIDMGIVSGRGVTTRSICEGGVQERAIADRYLGYSHTLSSEWPRTARLMKRIARFYEACASQEDSSSELDEDLYK